MAIILPTDIDWRMSLAVWFRNATVYRRTWTMNILPNFFEPVLYLIGMGLGLGSYVATGGGPFEGGYLAYVAPGLMAAAAMNGATFEVTYNMFIKMEFARLYDAYLSTPAELQDIVFGELMWAVTRALIYGVMFLLVLLGFTAFGHGLITSPYAVFLPLAMAVIGSVFAMIGQMFTASIKIIDFYSYYFTLFITPLFLFSGIFFPVSRFPHGETIAWFTPLYHSVRLVRGLTHGDLSAAMWTSLAWLLVVAGVLLLVVPNVMRRRLRR